MNYDKNKLLLRMNLSGCKYSRALERETKAFLENDAIVITRGSRGPAADPSIFVDMAFTVLAELPQELLITAIVGIAKKAVSFIWNKITFRPVIGKLTISDDNYDLLISSVESFDFSVEEIDISCIYKRVSEFVDRETKAGYPVLSVSLPNESVESEGRIEYVSGQGSFDLWEVTYRDGDRWFLRHYDAANQAFID